ncbi:specifically androgen-regulated gene protein [Pelobates fuscus]|uniref:specifically androgen-regulated gene protein n=1 Tax=Pelobates fuscus TaxID=191477 RepID=UPI002FE4A4E1
MPEKDLSTKHVGMETLGSTGSCDSMESISSNHSALSGDSYDYLSAEERECLMFLEETIDSLDNDVDSGLSNDELESAQTIPSPPPVEPVKISPPHGDKETLPKSTKIEEKKGDRVSVDLNKIIPPRQGYHSFPRIIQPLKEDVSKYSAESVLTGPNLDQEKSLYGKPRSLTSVSQRDKEDSISDLLLLPPPEPFRDPQFVDKRRSVTDPTDAREARYERFFPKLSVTSGHKEAPPAVGYSNTKVTPPVFPKPLSSNPLIAHSQEALNASLEKNGDGQFKQGPPTAPKPRKLPPHIVIKPSTGGGVAQNLEPQQRPRTFSAHERNMDKSGESIHTKIPHSKEQEGARREALKKLGLLQEKESTNDNAASKLHVPTKTKEISVSQGLMSHGHKDTYGKSVNLNQQEKPNILGTSPVQSSALSAQIGHDNVAVKEDLGKRRLSGKSNSLEKADELGVSASINEGSPSSVRNNEISRNKFSVKMVPQVKVDDNVDGPAHLPKEVLRKNDGSFKNGKVNINISSSTLKSNIQEKANEGQQVPHISATTPELQAKPDKLSDKKIKEGSLENVHLMSTSPGKTFSFPRPKEISISSTSPKVVLREGKSKTPDKNRHSTHFEPSGEQVLRFPQSSVPGLRQINIKSNTLERSGIGLSSSIPNTDGQVQKGGNSFFKKPLFSGNFLRNSRPRPASLGTGKDFIGMEPPPTEAEVTEGRRHLFSRRSNPAAPVTTVKITPKGSADEHHKEALKKLGILKE